MSVTFLVWAQVERVESDDQSPEPTAVIHKNQSYINVGPPTILIETDTLDKAEAFLKEIEWLAEATSPEKESDIRA